MFDNRLDGMEAMHARDMAAQTQLRFSLSKNHNFQRPEGQMSAMRPFPAPRYQMENLMNSNSPSNPYQPNFQHGNHLQNRVFVSPVTVTHVSSGHAINVDTRDFQPEVFSASSDSRGYLGPSSREEHFLHSGSDYHDQIEQISIPESGDSGLSRTPDNPSEGPSIQMIDPSFRPRNQTAPQASLEYLYQQKHFPAQRQRSNNMPPSSRIEFSVKLSLRAAQHSFGFLLGDGAIVEKVDGAPASAEDIQVGDRVTSINGRACDQSSRQHLQELISEAARYRSITLNISRTTRPPPPELHRTYTDLPLGATRFPQPGVPSYLVQPPYTPPVRYLSCRHLAPHSDDSSQGRHSWPHCPASTPATGPQPIRYQPRDEFSTPQLPHQLLYSNPGLNMMDGVLYAEDSILSTIHEVPKRQPGNSMHLVLETMRQLRDKYGPELEQRELQVLDSFLSDPDIIPAYKICKRMNRARQSLKRAEDPLPKITNSAHLLGDCLKDLRNGPLSDPDSSELTYLLSSLTLTHALVSHDRIATMDYFTPFPSPLYPSSGLTPLHSPGRLSPTISRSVSSSGLLEGTNLREFRFDRARSGSVASALQLTDQHTRGNSVSSFVYQRPISRTAYGEKGLNARIVLVRTSHRQMGCTVNKVGDSIIVTGTLRHSDAEKCGRLHPGDEILEVNGKTVRGRSSEQVMNFILSQTGTMIVFLIVPCSPGDKKELFIRAFYDFAARQVPDCPFVDLLLPFSKGEILRLLSCHDEEWWEAKQLCDPPEAVPGLIPARKKEDMSDLLSGETHEQGGKSGSKKRIRWPKSKKKKKSDLSLDPTSLPLTQDIVTYEEVGLLAPSANYQPRPILLVGAAGVGHKRVIHCLLDKYPHIFQLPVYHTSRPPKSHEKKGIEFHFTSRRNFEHCVTQKIILDPWESGSHMYGVSPTSLQVVVESGKYCIQALTPDSMRYIRNQTNFMPYVLFLAAPQAEVLREQLKQTQKGAFRRVRSDQGSRDKQITSIIHASREIAMEYGGYFDEAVTNVSSQATAEHIYQLSVRLKNEPQWVPISWIHTLKPSH